MSAVEVRITPLITGTNTGTTDIGSPVHTFSWPATQPFHTYTSGTGTSQMDTWFMDIRSLTTGATESLDLVGSALTDIFGTAISLIKLKVFGIYSVNTNTTNLTVGNVTNGITSFLGVATNSFVIKPDAFMLWSYPTGDTLTAGTVDLLKVANAAGATASYHLILGGSSA